MKKRGSVIIGLISILLIFGFIVELAKTIYDKKQYREYCHAPTQTIEIDGITTDYKKIENHQFYGYDLLYCEFGIGQLDKRVKGTDLYTISKNNDVLVNIETYAKLTSQSEIYVKMNKLNLLPTALSDDYVSYISLGFSKSDDSGFQNRQFILDLTRQDIEKTIAFCQSEDNLLKTKKIDISEGNIYSICCHIKGLEELFFYCPYEVVQNLNDKKYYLTSKLSSNTIYEIPDEYQEIIKSTVDIDI